MRYIPLLLAISLCTPPLTKAEPTIAFPTDAKAITQALTPTTSPNGRQAKGFSERDAKGMKDIAPDNPRVGALILFDFNSTEIKPESHSLLREFAEALQNGLPNATIVIEGHTDHVGTDAYNLNLSQGRAQAIKDFLVSAYAISEQRLNVVGYGESKPIETNDTEEGRSFNRRVEFVNQVR